MKKSFTEKVLAVGMAALMAVSSIPLVATAADSLGGGRLFVGNFDL